MPLNGSGIKEYIADMARRMGTTSVDIAQRIKNGETFTTSHGVSISLLNSRDTNKYIVARGPAGDVIDMIDPSQISGGRRKKRRNTKKARRVCRTRRRSTRKN